MISPRNAFFMPFLSYFLPCQVPWLECTYKPHYCYQNFSPLANATDLNRKKYVRHLTDPLALKLVRNGTKVSLTGSLMGL